MAHSRHQVRQRTRGVGLVRRLLAYLLLLSGVFLLNLVPAQAGPDRYGAIVVDAATGEVLHEEQADRRHYPASLTKMMTLYLLFDAVERGQLTMASRLTVSSKAASQPPSKVGVTAGSTISVEQAIHALAIKSGNDVAVVVAEGLAGSEAAFGRKMTAMARRLGMWRTNFFNASGLPDDRQLSTPRDMAKLSRALLYDFPQHYHYFSTSGFSYDGKRFNSHNRLLYSYGGADGIKTGYTRAAGYNISVSAVRSGRRLIVVVFGADSSKKRNRKAAALLDMTFPRADPGHPKTLVAQARSGGKLPALQPVLLHKPQPLAEPVLAEPVLAERPLEVAAVAAPASSVVQTTAQPAASAPAQAEAKAIPVEAAPVKPAAVLTMTAAAVTSAPAKPVQKSSADAHWSIQVGAFSLSDAATAAASEALQQSRTLAAGRIQVVEVMKGESRLYRGRVAGLAESDAREACDFRILHGAPCMVIAPGG